MTDGGSLFDDDWPVAALVTPEPEPEPEPASSAVVPAFGSGLTADEEVQRRARLTAEEDQRELARLRKSERHRRQVRDEVEAETRAEQATRRTVRLTPASAFRIRATRWAWADRMPVGEISLIPGREGAGKSTFLASMAAQITRGTLHGVHLGHPRSVLYAATEDSWEYTIAPRLLAAGADMHRVFRIDVLHEKGRFGKLSLPLDTNLIPKAAEEVDAAMLMCDPIISLVDDKINTFKAQELRSALEPLKAAIEEAGLALPGLVHFNKSKDTDVLSMISGSRAWAEMARAVIAIAVDKDATEYTCVVSQVKNNLGRSDLPHLKYTIESVTLCAADHEAVDEDTTIGRLKWTGESERGVEDILATSKVLGSPTGDVTNAVVAYVTQRYAELGGNRVPMLDVREHVGEDVTEDNLKQVLKRCVDRGMLVRPARGFYAPGPSAQHACAGCGRLVPVGANFCRSCAEGLDRDDRAIGGGQDDHDQRLW